MAESEKPRTDKEKRKKCWETGDPGSPGREYSETTLQYIDKQTAAIIIERYRKVTTLLQTKKAAMESIIAVLLGKEMVDAKDFAQLAGVAV